MQLPNGEDELEIQNFDQGRTKLLVNPKFQLSFLFIMVGVSLLAVGAFYFADLYFFWKLSRQGQDLGLPANHIFFRFIQNQRTTMSLIFAVTATLAFSSLTLVGLMLSNRVAGPLHRLKRHCDAVANGLTLEDVRFREGDYFQDLAESYNRKMARYREAVDPLSKVAPDQEKKKNAA